jgi:hypothetical protein
MPIDAGEKQHRYRHQPKNERQPLAVTTVIFALFGHGQNKESELKPLSISKVSSSAQKSAGKFRPRPLDLISKNSNLLMFKSFDLQPGDLIQVFLPLILF